MNIYAYALKMEKDGENFYREIAGKTCDDGLKRIATMLADQELKHYNAIMEMHKGICSMADSDVLNNVKNIFSKMQGSDIFDADRKQMEAYRKAQDIEKQSEKFYKIKAIESDSPAQKKLFERLAEEEEKHYFLLDNLIEFLSRPQQWLENAEWYHLDEY